MIYPDKKNGELTGRWRVEVQRNGKRARGRFNSMDEAKEAERTWLAAFPMVSAKTREDKRGVPKTLADLVERLGDIPWRGRDSREITESRLAVMIKLLGPKSGISDVSTEHLDRAIASLVARGLKGSTINKYLSSLHVILNHAKDRRWLGTLPAFPWLDEDEGRIRWITSEEEVRLMQHLPNDIGVLVKVAIRTGMRRGELLSLQPEQVERQWVHLWKTKTKTPRTIPINDRTYADLMFLLDTGMPTEHVLRYQWEVARKAMGLQDDPWFTFHVTRHTCATRLVQANVNLRIIQRWLGHKRIETTIRYAQVSDQMLSTAFAQAEDFLHVKEALSPTHCIAAE